MLQKLYAIVDQTASPDKADALQYQEVLLPGHLITVFLKVTKPSAVKLMTFFFSFLKINSIVLQKWHSMLCA